MCLLVEPVSVSGLYDQLVIFETPISMCGVGSQSFANVATRGGLTNHKRGGGPPQARSGGNGNNNNNHNNFNNNSVGSHGNSGGGDHPDGAIH